MHRLVWDLCSLGSPASELSTLYAPWQGRAGQFPRVYVDSTVNAKLLCFLPMEEPSLGHRNTGIFVE